MQAARRVGAVPVLARPPGPGGATGGGGARFSATSTSPGRPFRIVTSRSRVMKPSCANLKRYEPSGRLNVAIPDALVVASCRPAPVMARVTPSSGEPLTSRVTTCVCAAAARGRLPVVDVGFGVVVGAGLAVFGRRLSRLLGLGCRRSLGFRRSLGCRRSFARGCLGRRCRLGWRRGRLCEGGR